MFTPKKWRKRRDRTELVSGGRVEMVFTEPTFDELAKLFEDLDEQIRIEEERAENRVDNMKSHKANLYGKCI